ncbi:L-fucose isomerase [Alicyclobacillus acidiphilus]|uniref:L-fucose isomerase n=1 Tax=Alicyclobacillus acidiphilus TaxID=182455 RepID=UPI000ADB1CE7
MTATSVVGMPRIGIRPVIDGRRGGIRESLEGVTMQMAHLVADLLSTSLKHANGQPVECVIADTCIGGVAEASKAAEKFALHNVGVTITVTPSWCYPMETMDMDKTMPKAIWGFNGTERPGAVYLAAALAAHNQNGQPAFSIYGREVQDIDHVSIPKDVQEKMLRFAKAGLAVAAMKGKSYLSMGSVAMGIAGCIVNDDFFHDYLGMRTEYVDMTEFVRRMELEIYDRSEFQNALAWVRRHCQEGPDVNPTHLQRSRAQKDKDWETVVKMTLIARDLMVGNDKLDELGYGEEALGHNAIAAGFQGQRQWTDYFPNGDFMEAILNSSFDWNGVREPYVLATENDSLNAVTMLFGHLLTQRAQIFADVRTYWSQQSIQRVTGVELPRLAKDGIIHLTNSGPASLDGTGGQEQDGQAVMKPFWEIGDDDVRRCLDATRWCPAVDFFRGGGFSSQYLTRGGMPLTMVRLNLIKGLGPVLQIAEGHSVDLPQEIHDVLNNRTNPTWPTTWFVPRLTGKGAFSDVYSVMSHWGSNHCALSYGHVGADFITLASMLRIPVAMHNVDDSQVFRPSAWHAFGTMDLEGADFRSCSAYGPLYR